MAAAHVLVLVLSKDLGSALIFFITYLTMLFVATGSWGYLLGGIAAGSGASVIAYYLFAHVRTRVMAWLDPWSDIDNRGYQITQSLFAIGTGGWFGMGLYQGMPYKIPVVEKDFVFAAISEELGGIFAICLLLVCLGCFLQFMMIASRMQAIFYKLIAFGLGMEYIIQVFLTIGGVIKFIPSTGVTLPLVSYGGSSILSTFIMFSVIQGLYILKKNDEEEYE
jgi:cell division protein FtsW (lipid II flippase)